MRYSFILFFTLLACSHPKAQTGEWYVNANGSRFTVSIAQQGEKFVAYSQSQTGSCNERLDSVTWDGNAIEWRRLLNGATQWHRVTIEDGVMIGRFTHQAGNKAPKPDLSAYRYHVTGWSGDHFNQITPAVFDVNVNGYKGRLRVDRAGDQFIGRLKFYAKDDALHESLEEEVNVTHWDGETVAFTRSNCSQSYVGEVKGDAISGTFSHADRRYSWSGRRAEVLTYGLGEKTQEDRAIWQARTRRILHRLMMAGNPAPLSVNVEVVRDYLPPIKGSLYAKRDDDPASYPQNYRLTELKITYTLPNWMDGEPIQRVTHAYLAKPTTPPPGGLEKYPLLLAVNGHSGSGWKMFDGSGFYYYGDAFARRGYMVLAVDISHRPVADRMGYSEWSENGDDPEHGNYAHPSIKPGTDPLSTDWEEAGERTWDVMRGLDYALSRPDVDPARVAVAGLSMGGEIASYVGALDPRVAVTIPAGYSPDLNVVKYHKNHGCWTWAWADVRDYVDQSDILSLIAPRALIVQTGKADRVFSDLGFAGDKQVVRRARVAGGPAIHFLHPLDHEFRAGVVTYTSVTEPLLPGDLTWQTNGDVTTDGRSLFDYVRVWLNF